MNARAELLQATVAPATEPEKKQRPLKAGLLTHYLTDEELAAEYRRSLRTIKKWRAEGKGPKTSYIGNTPYTSIEDAIQYQTTPRKGARSRSA